MKKVFLAFLFILSFFLIAPYKVSAFGVSPPFVTSHRLVRGSHHETTIFLVQGNPNEDLDVKAVFDVPDKIRPWLSVDKGEAFIIPKGVQQFPISVRIDVPENGDFGIYRGYLRINTVPKHQEGQQIAISVGARIDINFKVGEGVIADFLIRKLHILDIIQGDPLKVEVVFENTGNVPIALERMTFDLFDKLNQTRLGFSQVEKFDEVPAFTKKTFIVKFPIDFHLGIGEYWGDVNAYRDGKSINNLRTVFNVTEKKVDYTPYGIGFLVVLFIGTFFIKKKRKHS